MNKKKPTVLIHKAKHSPTKRDLQKIAKLVKNGYIKGNVPKGINWEVEI